MTTPRPYIMGIDPGLSGAVAVLDPVAKAVIGIHDMPVHTDKKGKRQLDIYALAMTIDSYSHEVRFAVIEKVAAMTGREGRQSMFRFGYVTGIATGILGAYMVPIVQAEPAAWKSAMGLPRDKGLSRRKAAALFPDSARYFERAKDDGRAEALLMAVFAARYAT